MTKILVAEPLDFSPEAIRILSQAGRVDLKHCDGDSFLRALGEYDVVWFRLAHRIDRRLLAAATRCRIFATPVTGLDHIDLVACAELGISVVSLKGEIDFLRNVRATAELTVAITLALLRQIPQAAASVLAGNWDRDCFRGRELYHKTVGIIGLGRLGSLVAGYFGAFGARVIAYDPRPDFPHLLAQRTASLYELLEQADIVSIHADYNSATRGLLGYTELRSCKRGAVLINTARGGIVDEQALIASLEEGQLAGAALDVLNGEPAISGGHPLVSYANAHPNLLIVPHIGGNTAESFQKTECFLAGRVLDAIAKRGSVPSEL